MLVPSYPMWHVNTRIRWSTLSLFLSFQTYLRIIRDASHITQCETLRHWNHREKQPPSSSSHSTCLEFCEHPSINTFQVRSTRKHPVMTLTSRNRLSISAVSRHVSAGCGRQSFKSYPLFTLSFHHARTFSVTALLAHDRLRNLSIYIYILYMFIYER